MDIQQRLPNVGGPEVTIRKNINEEIRDHFKSFHEAFDRDLRKFIQNKGTRINLNRITMRKPEVTLSHCMIQCMEIQNRSANVRGLGVTLCSISGRRPEVTISHFMKRYPM
jgi:hypothetical protein